MKKILFSALMALVVVACKLDGYSEYSLTSYSDFEFDFTSFDADSLYIYETFEGGTSSFGLAFNSMRSGVKEPMTGGIGATMKKDSSIVLKSDNKYPQYTMFAPEPWHGSVCAVYYENDDPSLMPDHDILFEYPTTGNCTPSYFMINNTQQTVYDVLSEDSPMKYEPGDYLKLTITGSGVNEYTNLLEETGKVEFYLADWRGMKDEPDSVLTSWKRVSLSKLGYIDYIDFTLESNKENLVKTFCFDYLVSSVYVKF